MFTGIIESLGRVVAVIPDQQNVNFQIESNISDQLKIDQSVAHDGVCLTVTALEGRTHWVTAIAETLTKTNLGQWQVGQVVNLERAMLSGARFDGHFVQGHVDCTAQCVLKSDAQGSWLYRFEYAPQDGLFVAQKGSITVNGVSLTVVDAAKSAFSVAIIPYTYTHTNFESIEQGTCVNLEFDMLGKYLHASLKNLLPQMLKDEGYFPKI
ncbi:MAG: riboflavin synthase [Cytophagales bacterium]|nr:MAG: riboflavin synthase [Cytophagales bacterium]TAF60418.1 MAG: riboflavin synthase [Cytophagales bacterium]